MSKHLSGLIFLLARRLDISSLILGALPKRHIIILLAQGLELATAFSFPLAEGLESKTAFTILLTQGF